MASVCSIIIRPSNINNCTIVLTKGSNTITLTRNDFYKNASSDLLYSEPMGGYPTVTSATAVGYPAPRITVEETPDGEDTYIDFRPEQLFAIGSDTISSNDYIYVDDLLNPTGIFNNQGWSSLGTSDWSWHSYSNFNRNGAPVYDSTTGKWTVYCSLLTGNSTTK